MTSWIGTESAPAIAPLSRSAALRLLVYRNYIVYRQEWKLFVTGFFEPFFYLLSIGIGVGALIDAFEFNGRLATPLTTSDVARGEIAWSQLRGATYSAAFLLIMTAMGLVHSWWAILALPAALLIGFSTAAVCMALTTYLKSWQDFDKITLIQLPMFLFSATFFPISAFPEPVRWIVECTPLYRGVVLCRELTTGALSWGSAVSVVYLVAMGALGLMLVGKRLDKLLLT
jgi:lipooligosaccharide transport system permease protein